MWILFSSAMVNTSEGRPPQLKLDMTTQETISELRAEIEELKAQRELDAVKEELNSLKAKPSEVQPQKSSITQSEIQDTKVAAVRQNNNALAHFVGGPIASIYYGVKTSYWTPTLAATGVAVVCLPVALVDYGITLSVVPPLTSCLLMCNKSTENRRKLGISMPEKADELLAKFSSF